MRKSYGLVLLAASVLIAQDRRPGATAAATTTAHWTIVGWNDLGMHCMDGKDYSVYSILPPFNTFHAQLIDSSGKLVLDPKATGLTVSYQAVADPTKSINKSTIGKTNFWDYVKPLYGASVAPDMGLAGFPMPGAANTARAMSFNTGFRWFSAEGVPISPYDDAGVKNYYPMMRLTAKDRTGKELAHTDIVLPVSDELDCRTCHASGSPTTARPNAGWTFLQNDPERDYKFNVLRLHDDRNKGSAKYIAALAGKGFAATGLYDTVTQNKTPILCAGCHASNALPGTGLTGISPLTQAVHARHAQVLDPVTNLPLDSEDNRSACYRCHPGSVTRCLRGAMGNATAPDGSMLMQCQSCHGGMSMVGASTRKGWLEEPSCQNCHTGTATQNSGQIRYTSAFGVNGQLRTPLNLTFATNANTPATGLNLYRFSKGHGGLQCEACHGSTHAEFPSSHTNDNLQSIALQGHTGTLAECGACHTTVPSTVTGGPHGLHPIGQSWVSRHGDIAERGASQCTTCHGADYRGTVLSRAQANRSFSGEFGTRAFTRGTVIGCYSCHNGPRGN